MPNITVTSTTNAIKVDFGDYYPTLQFSKATFDKKHIESIKLDSSVQINMDKEISWLVTYDGASGTYQVDSVDSVAPTSNTDLYNKLSALIE